MKHLITGVSEVVDAHVNAGSEGAPEQHLYLFFFFSMKKEAKSSSESKDHGC